jgi:guanylate kinase
MVDDSALNTLRINGEIIWEHRRYGAVYAIDRGELIRQLADHVVVIHLGQLGAVDAVTGAVPATHWVVAYLWCERDIAAARIAARGTGDADQRLWAWDQTEPPGRADLTINTGAVDAAEAARLIHDGVIMAGRAGRGDAEDAADIAAANAALAEPGEDIPASRVWAELGLSDDE